MKVPDVYENMTSARVITMEFVEGIKINDIARIEAAGIDRELLAKRSAESYLSQVPLAFALLALTDIVLLVTVTRIL